MSLTDPQNFTKLLFKAPFQLNFLLGGVSSRPFKIDLIMQMTLRSGKILRPEIIYYLIAATHKQTWNSSPFCFGGWCYFRR